MDRKTKNIFHRRAEVGNQQNDCLIEDKRESGFESFMISYTLEYL